MRKTFIETITKIAETNNKLILLLNDTGAIVFDDFWKRFPSQIINCGIAEQNMIGVAAGLSLCGFMPIVYGITPFVIMRCYEQIRNDLSLQQANVKIIGVGDAETYKLLGVTHYAYEDEDLKLIVNMPKEIHVLTPKNIDEIRNDLLIACQSIGPFYITLGKR